MYLPYFHSFILVYLFLVFILIYLLHFNSRILFIYLFIYSMWYAFLNIPTHIFIEIANLQQDGRKNII